MLMKSAKTCRVAYLLNVMNVCVTFTDSAPKQNKTQIELQHTAIALLMLLTQQLLPILDLSSCTLLITKIGLLHPYK